MRQVLFALAAAVVLIAPADAASRSVEKGVAIWRGAKAEAPAAPKIERRQDACAARKIVVLHTSYWPVRRLRVHGFSAGDGFAGPAERSGRLQATSGFYADRMARGH